MTLVEWITVILGFTLIIAFIIAGARLLISKKHLLIIPEYKKSHKRKEARLLNHILEDMRNNPHEWISTPYDVSLQKDASFINDKKNMAVVASSTTGQHVVIKLNLTSAHKYLETAEDTIAIPITGDHVTRFLRKVEECIDTRDKELTFFETTLKNRL